MPLVKLVPLSQFECKQDTVVIIQTDTEVLAAELDPSVAKEHNTFPLLEPIFNDMDNWMAYFVNIGRLEVGMPMDRLALTELIMKRDGVMSEPTPREVWWVQITTHSTIFPLETRPHHAWLTDSKHREALVSIYYRLASTSKAGVN